jgi:hypothetical protein
MEIHPDAPANPLYDDLKELLDYERSYAYDWRRAGKLRPMDIAEHNEAIIKKSLLDVQNTCLPTLNQLRSERNMVQLQERVYLKLRPHIDALNVCIVKSRTAV